ncbi:MAG: hypothetical protein IPJ03_16130 [Ignavibacteriales bacterium]|nr:hypothetical protein [Ignavibacteriales bacterium]
MEQIKKDSPRGTIDFDKYEREREASKTERTRREFRSSSKANTIKQI